MIEDIRFDLIEDEISDEALDGRESRFCGCRSGERFSIICRFSGICR